MTHSLDLNDGWTVTAGRQEHVVPDDVWGVAIAAVVPGSVHDDLRRANLLPDPYFGRNELIVQWVGNAEWIYQREFELAATDSEHVDLVFDGLDTVSTVELNGVLVGRTFNQHRQYRFDVRQHVVVGANSLRVTFHRVRDYGIAARVALTDRPHNYPEPYNFVRKSAANFGWDWGPNLVTAGIWKPVRLESWGSTRLAAVQPHARPGVDGGTIDCEVELDGAPMEGLTLDVHVEGRHWKFPIEDSTKHSLRVDVPDAELWWPRGLGAQRLYRLDVSLTDRDGVELDSWSRRIGFRTVEHKTALDAVGQEYALKINGVDLFVRGANWIPDDCFVGSIDRNRYEHRITQAAAANVNLLRVWGGGIYEKEDFYEICDEQGMLVSQDFLFACAAYPEEEPLFTEVQLEARYNISRLMPHPSLVLWNGSNENIWGYFDWGWREPLADKTWGLKYYLELLPALVDELDPSTPYWPSSPYSGTMDRHPNDSDFGNQHLWDVWNRVDYTRYAEVRPRFVSEFGFQGPANWATINESVSDAPLSAEGTDLLHHQKARDGNEKLARGMAPHLPTPDGFDEWHYFTQLNQARAIAFGIEHFRSLRPHCMGAIMWQLNDCWPVTSWAAIDGKGRLKPLWFELRRVYADRLLTIQPDDGGLAVTILNDGAQPWRGSVVTARIDLSGNQLATESSPFDLAPHSSQTISLSARVTTPDDASREVLSASVDELRVLRFFKEDRDMEFGKASYSVEVEDAAQGVAVTVTAHSVVRDIVLAADRVDSDSVVDSQVITLLPGERHTFRIVTTVGSTHPGWTARSVVNVVNDSEHYAHTQAGAR